MDSKRSTAMRQQAPRLTAKLIAAPAITRGGKAVWLAGFMALMILAASQAFSGDTGMQPAARVSPYRPGVPPSASSYYQAIWGVDNFLLRSTASGNLIRFSYRVTDPVRAKQLVDKSATPYLIGLRSRAVLQVPVMDKVGALRQTPRPQPGQALWVTFSNKGNLVRVGDRANVVIGAFHADGLVVE
jgi:hypothetical protein